MLIRLLAVSQSSCHSLGEQWEQGGFVQRNERELRLSLWVFPDA